MRRCVIGGYGVSRCVIYRQEMICVIDVHATRSWENQRRNVEDDKEMGEEYRTLNERTD